MKRLLPAIFISAILTGSAFASGEELYSRHCASCHHPERYGLNAPPLIPEYFGIKKDKELASIVANGLDATQMPGFKGTLSENEIKEIVAFIRTPAKMPTWGREEMLSTWELSMLEDDREAPYDLENFFMVVEGGTGKVHFMDGAGFDVLGSVKAGAVHGGPKFSPSLKDAYVVSRDGWITKYDIVNLREVGRLRAGISARNLAISSDGKRLAVATLLPEGLLIMDAFTMKPVKIFNEVGAVSAVYALKGSQRFVAALKDSPEVILVDEKTLETKRIATGQPMTDFFIEPQERYIIGTSRDGSEITVVDLKEGKAVKSMKSGVRMPHLASAAVWSQDGDVYAAFPHIGEPLVSVLKLYHWELVAQIKMKGSGFFARTHEYIPHIWVDTNTDTIQLIDKKTFKVVGEVTPQPGKKAMHIEFTKEGSFALVSIWEEDGAVVIYDSRSLKPVKTLPFKKPVGKYNATNKKF